jgi:hypothetical protein
MPFNMVSYFQQLYYYTVTQATHGVIYPHALYVIFFVMLNGFPLTALSVIGLAVLLRRPSVRGMLILLPALVLFITLSIKTRGNSLRYISVALPFVAAMSALGLEKIVLISGMSKRAWPLWVIAGLVSVSSLLHVRPLLDMRSGYAEAYAYVAQHGGTRYLATNNSFFEFYAGRNVAEQVPGTIDALEQAMAEGDYSYVVLDFMSHRVLGSDTKQAIETYATPVMRLSNPVGTHVITLIESLGYRHHTPAYLANALADPHAALIEIYAAADVLHALRRAQNATSNATP